MNLIKITARHISNTMLEKINYCLRERLKVNQRENSVSAIIYFQGIEEKHLNAFFILNGFSPVNKKSFPERCL